MSHWAQFCILINLLEKKKQNKKKVYLPAHPPALKVFRGPYMVIEFEVHIKQDKKEAFKPKGPLRSLSKKLSFGGYMYYVQLI